MVLSKIYKVDQSCMLSGTVSSPLPLCYTLDKSCTSLCFHMSKHGINFCTLVDNVRILQVTSMIPYRRNLINDNCYLRLSPSRRKQHFTQNNVFVGNLMKQFIKECAGFSLVVKRDMTWNGEGKGIGFYGAH